MIDGVSGCFWVIYSHYFGLNDLFDKYRSLDIVCRNYQYLIKLVSTQAAIHLRLLRHNSICEYFGVSLDRISGSAASDIRENWLYECFAVND